MAYDSLIRPISQDTKALLLASILCDMLDLAFFHMDPVSLCTLQMAIILCYMLGSVPTTPMPCVGVKYIDLVTLMARHHENTLPSGQYPVLYA